MRFLAISILLLLPHWTLAASVCPPLTRVGLSEQGYSAFQEGGVLKGVAVDIMNDMARRSGCKIELIWMPRSRVQAEWMAGTIDLAPGSLPSAERAAKGVFLPYAYTQMELLLPKRVGGNFTSLADFAQHGTARLNLIRGVPYSPQAQARLDELTRDGRVQGVTDYSTVFAKIAVGRADGTLVTPIIYMKFLRDAHLEDQFIAFPVAELPPQMVGVYASRKTLNEQWLRSIAQALRAIVADQTVSSIYSHYVDPATTARLAPLDATPILKAFDAAYPATSNAP
ncbi:MAG: transporter substrate-binding domain-containing protein [Pseudomonadota bacterium]